jgi:Holliday junction resolvase-like predicted endonuclease
MGAEDSDSQDRGAWFREAHVQKALVDALSDRGWQVHVARNTDKREPGIDVIAQRNGQMLGVEVKGYPTTGYADPRRAAEKKKARPEGQAWNWYSKAILAAMMLRSRHPDWVSAVVLPVTSRYTELYQATKGSLSAAKIQVWWIDPSGELLEDIQG